MYVVKIQTKKGEVVIYLDNLLQLEKSLQEYPDHEKVEATKILTKQFAQKK